MNNIIARPKAVIFLHDWGEDCRPAAETLGAQVVREYVEDRDIGNASIDRRPASQLMLDRLLASRDIKYVIATNPTRLTRRADVMAAILQKIEAAGATLIFCQP